MRFRLLTLMSISALVMAASGLPAATSSMPTSGKGPAFKYIGTLAFGPGDVLFVADAQDVSITAVRLGRQASGATPGTKNVPAIDEKIAALLGTDARSIRVTDMIVNPANRNTFVSALRGTGADAAAVLLRVDGAGTIDVLSLGQLSYTRIVLPNAPPEVTPLKVGGREIPVSNYPSTVDGGATTGVQTITHMAYVDGTLLVSGLSNEEFASKMRVIPYPFRTADGGASVEIYHGSHGQYETFSPVYTFVPYTINGVRSIVASYLCTPLVKFPIEALKPGSKVRGTTIGEFGNRNRPVDMIVYNKGGKDYLLMSNNARGVMKVPTSPFGNAAPITQGVKDTGGVPFETVASMTNVQQLDLLDQTHALLLVRSPAGLSLEAAALP